MGGVHPHHAAAAAKARDAELARVRARVLARPSEHGVHILERLLIGELVCSGHHLLDVLHFPELADAEVWLVGHGEIAGLGDPAHDVFDVLVQSPDFGDYQHDRVLAAALRHGVVRGNLADLGVAAVKTVHRRLDRLGEDGLRCDRKARRDASCDEAAAVDLHVGQETVQIRIL